MVKIFVLHGMGNHAKGWWDNGTEKAFKKLKRYDKLRGFGDTGTLADFCDGYDFRELNYDDKCTELFETMTGVNKWDKLIANMKTGGLQTNDINAWVGDTKGLFEKLSLFGTSDFAKDALWDVFLCANQMTRNYLALHVANQIIKELEKDNGEWAIIAHSLGSALVQDVLNYIYKAGGGTLFKPARCIIHICNFSLTQTKAPVNQQYGHLLCSHDPVSTITTKVWPAENIDHSTSICQAYIHTRHKLDPLSYLCQDMPKEWHKPDKSFDASKYHVFGHSDLHHVPSSLSADIVNTGSFLHSIENYFANPKVHMTFFSYLNSEAGRLRNTQSIAAAQKRFTNQSRANLGGQLVQLGADIPGDKPAWLKAFAKLVKDWNA